jgi:NHS family nucleoside permease-like MFS transporter
MNLKVRLALMNFLQFAVWGAYLTCMGIYLSNIGMASHIGPFFACRASCRSLACADGHRADRWVSAQRLLASAICWQAVYVGAAWYGHTTGEQAQFGILFTLYSLSVAFYMPTLALSNSVAYTALTQAGMDTVKDFPPIRVFGTIGFICSMWFVDLMGFKSSELQFVVSGVLSVVLFIYTFTLPSCPVSADDDKKSFVDAFGLRCLHPVQAAQDGHLFIFSMLLGVSLQITNGFATPFIESFRSIPEYADTFGVQHSVILYSLSQVSETLCILMIPFFMKRYGIKNVMLIAMFAWFLRFGCWVPAIPEPACGCLASMLSMAWPSTSSTSRARCLSTTPPIPSCGRRPRVCSCS